MSNDTFSPRWLREFRRFLPLKSQFVLTGNVRDLQPWQFPNTSDVVPMRIDYVLAGAFIDAGYHHVFTFDPLHGFRIANASNHDVRATENYLRDIRISTGAAGIDQLITALQAHTNHDGAPAALIVDFASRLLRRPSLPAETEHILFTTAQILSQQSMSRPFGEQALPYFNTVVWLTERESDLPDWFTLGNPSIRVVHVATPDRAIRESVTRALIPVPPEHINNPQPFRKAVDEVVDKTNSMSLQDIHSILMLADVEGVPIERIGDAVHRYKLGVEDDPWAKIPKQRILDGETLIRKRIKGQNTAVVHMLDIIKRAMTGIGDKQNRNRPRGVVFLAGPTGVGKTELAKTITELIFGDESAYIRFDMSEFGAEHSDQRLIGAPPGYIGYDSGGELTNAIREKPFSVILFDEIEKAHPRILDKFLQILDDGVLTSGRGEKVWFSESIIIFTSNLGIYSVNENGQREANVTPDQDYSIVRDRVLSEIKNYFRFTLNRPEILNRIGENILVFDFIRPEVAGPIFDQMVDAVLVNAREKGKEITIAPSAYEQLKDMCLMDLSNGGRGIRNHLESHLINPLARALFSHPDGHPANIVAFSSDGIILE
jgi:hypothetical protein